MILSATTKLSSSRSQSDGTADVMSAIVTTKRKDSSQGALLPSITKSMVFTLRGKTFRVTQVIAESDAVYLKPKYANGRWADWDRRGCMSALQAALAAQIADNAPKIST